MISGSVNSIESYSTLDGPGIRCVVFLNKCNLRCKYCHNPEMWNIGDNNYTSEELVNKIKRYKPYFKNGGGITFSGGEPLLQIDFLIEVCKLLKEEDINIALDTAGYGCGGYHELLKYIDLIIYDIKDINEISYENLTGGNINKTWEFLEASKSMNKKFWIRQVIVPGIHDNEEFINGLNKYIHDHFILDDILKIEFIPYHKLGIEKYEALKLPYRCLDIDEMDKDKCNELYNKFLNIYNSSNK